MFSILIFLASAVPSPLEGEPDYRNLSKRSVSNSIERRTNPRQICTDTLVCGYALRPISTSSRRELEYQKRCTCSDSKVCILSRSLSGRRTYVFKCRERRNPETGFEFPTSMG